MPPRSMRTPPPGSKPGFHPTNDASTYRELLKFEERLKTNSALLRRQKRRYQFFLLGLFVVLAIAASDFVLDTTFLMFPINLTLRHTPALFGLRRPLQSHAYVAPGTCLVAIMTLFLFYASGMFSEKIGFANKYVLHANRTLRSFNMYLNVRPRRSSPLSYIIPMLRSPTTSPLPPAPLPSLSRRSSQRDHQTPKRAATQITPIPPPENPRGELIFSSRVDKSFRESYERYRAAYERKREEKQREANAGGYWSWFLMKKRSPSNTSAEGKAKDGERTPGRGRTNRTPSGSRINTPLTSRRPSPTGSTASTSSIKRRSVNLESVPEKSTLQGELRTTPTPSVTETEGENADPPSGSSSFLPGRSGRSRNESFSFLLGRPDYVTKGKNE